MPSVLLPPVAGATPASAPETIESRADAESTLSPVEAQRAVSILEETIEKLGFLGSITPDVLQHRDELSKFVGDEISHIITEQRLLEQRYEELISQRGALKGLSNKSKYKEVQHQIQEVSRALRESTQNLCRNLKDNPNISGNLMKIQRERNELIEILNETVRELQEANSYRALLTKVQEDKSAQDRLQQSIQREKDMTAAVRELDADLSREKSEHQQRVTRQKAEIAQLKDQLHTIKSKTSVDSKYSRKEAHAMTSATLRTYRQEEREKEVQIKTSEQKLEMETVVHKESVEFLKRKQAQLSGDLDKWKVRYDNDFGALQAEYDELKKVQLANRERLDQLQARKAADDAAEAKKAEEAAREAENERVRVAEAKRQNESANILRVAMLKYLERKKIRDAKAPKGKGKKGKKGKK